MGNDPAKAEHTLPSPEEPRIQHERFERYRYIPEQDLLQVTIDVPQEREMKQWEGEVVSLNRFEHRQNLLLPIKHEYVSKGWCGNAGIARVINSQTKIYYEHFPYLFSEELENRVTTRKHFEEEELWYLLYCLVGCAKDFSRSQKRIGDVRPHNIFINEQGQVKVACLLSWPFEKSGFEKTAYEKTLTYLAPEEMALISKGNYENKINQVLAESFSIGLTLLEAGLLFNASEIYSVENRAMDVMKLKAKVDEWLRLQFSEGEGITNYSPLLKNIVAALCTVQPEEREISLDVEDLLRPYQEEIMNLKPFDHQAIDFQAPIINRPAQQHQKQSFSQRRVNAIPTQSYTVSNSIEPKQLTSYGPPAEAYRQQIMQVPVKVNSQVGYGSTVPYGTPFDTKGGYREVFTHYAANQPERPNTIVIPNQNYDQQFHKYSVLNQQPQPQVVTSQVQPVQIIQKPNSAQTFLPPFPTSNLNINSNEFGANNFFTSSNFQQSQYVSNIGSGQYVSSLSQQPPASSSNDFLRKIDEQLQNSRKLYPS